MFSLLALNHEEGLKWFLFCFFFSMISLSNLGFFMLFCALRVQVLQKFSSGCNLLLFLNQRKISFFYAHILVRAVGNWKALSIMRLNCQVTRVAVGSSSHSYHLSLEPAFPAGSNSLKWQKGHTLPLWLCSLVCRDAQVMQRGDDTLILHHMSQQIALCIMSFCCMICTALSIQQGLCHAHPYVLQMIYIFIISLPVLLPSSLDWCQSLIATVTQD